MECGGRGPLMPPFRIKATQKSGIWHHLFLSRCDQSGDLLLCFNREVKGACGMRTGRVCVCVCVYRGIEGSFAPRWDPGRGPWLTPLPRVFGCGRLPRVTGSQVRVRTRARELSVISSPLSSIIGRHRRHQPLTAVLSGVSLASCACLSSFR